MPIQFRLPPLRIGRNEILFWLYFHADFLIGFWSLWLGANTLIAPSPVVGGFVSMNFHKAWLPALGVVMFIYGFILMVISRFEYRWRTVYYLAFVPIALFYIFFLLSAFSEEPVTFARVVTSAAVLAGIAMASQCHKLRVF